MERQFSERQLIRWAIPGWITLFLVTLLTFVHLWFNAGFRSSVWSVLQKLDGGTIAAGGAAVIAFGFALGFILSQIYFALYGCKWEFCVKLVGGGVNYKQVVDALDSFKSTLEKYFGHWPAKIGVRTERQKWEVSIVAAWWCAMNVDEKRMVWEERNNYLVAVYHATGAILIGTYLTGLCYLFAVILPRWAELSDLWRPLLINLAILAAWVTVLFFGRSNTEVSHRNLMKHALHYFYQKDTDESNSKRIT